MSVKMMALVWELDISTLEKLVMLALADCANEDGECWPSIATLCRKTGAGERTVQRSIRLLEENGVLRRVMVTGKGNRYFLNPRQTVTPARQSPPPETTQTPATVAPKPSRTIKHTNTEKRAREIPDDWKPSQFSTGSKSRAIVDGWPPGELAGQLEHFTAHHRGKGSKFKDWQDAWSTWVLNSRKFRNERSNQNIRPSNGNGNRRSSLAIAIDDGLEWLGAQAQVS